MEEIETMDSLGEENDVASSLYRQRRFCKHAPWGIDVDSSYDEEGGGCLLCELRLYPHQKWDFRILCENPSPGQ